jgi:DNA segregation ATPase FtsK/SpoIIIE, S-DNA-T family
LSWIKKIFTMFQNDDELDEIEQGQPVSKSVKKEQVEKREIEAKVLYQYPKGQFRFPLIPDGEAAPDKSQPRKGRPEKVSEIDEVKPFIKEQGSLRIKNERKSVDDSLHHQSREPAVDARSTLRRKTAREPIETYKPNKAKAVDPAPKFHFETRKDSKPKFRQPFKPSEIPSPIYAFNRPPRKSQPQSVEGDVEYELTGFERGQVSAAEEMDHDGTQSEHLAPNPEQNPDSTGVHDKIPAQEIYIEDDLAETQGIEASEYEEQLNQSDLETEALDIILRNEPGFKSSNDDTGIKTISQAVQVAEQIEANDSQQSLKEVKAVDSLQSLEETEAAGSQRLKETEAINSQQRFEETEAIAQQSLLETEAVDSQLSPEDSESNPQVTEVIGYELIHDEGIVQPVDNGKEEAREIAVLNDESEPENSPGTETKAEDKPAEPKRQLPFNVLMLKQDKRKWEQRNTSKYPSFMTEGRNPSTSSASVNEAETDVDGTPLAVTGQKNQDIEEVLPAVSSSDILPKVQGEHPVRQQETLTAAASTETAETQQDRLNGAAHPEAGKRPQDTLASPIGVPSKSDLGQARTEPAVTNSASVQMNRQFQQEEHRSAENEVTLQPEILPAAAYEFPPLDLLSPPVFKAPDPEWISGQEHMLNETLRNFNVGARVVNVTQGPSVTRFEVQPEPGVKVNKITNLSDDIKLSLAAKDIRIEAPIPGKHTIGIEVPNHSSRPVLLSEILQSPGFIDIESPLSVALGLDIAGNPIVTDLKKMPHGLIAGATGSGKSVCINTMLVSLLYKAHPDEVKLLLIDPKMVELAPYNRIPHLVSPVITDVKAATASLKWAVEEMERRYELFAHTGVRDISRFNELAEKHRRFSDKLPYIVIVIDELADLMMMAPGDVEEAICRIAQKARACGIHLIIATQRPSVDVITGLIKANVPTRIAFSVSSQVDSRTIIDISGAEKLLGRGDMLFLENGSSKPFRLQGTYVTDNEIDDIVAFVREQRAPQYLFEQDELLKKAQVTEDEDELFYEACEFVIDQGGASTSSVQRRFKIGYNRAARLIEMMEQQGFISEGKGSKPRDVLITASDLEALQETSAFN